MRFVRTRKSFVNQYEPVDAPVVGEDVDDLVVAKDFAGAPLLKLNARSHGVPAR